MVSGISQAYADGSLTKDQLDERNERALRASTMGELRSAGEGLVEVPPALPAGPMVRSAGGFQQNRVNPALLEVRWSRLVWPGVGAVLGLILLGVQAALGVVVLLVALGLVLWTLRPLLATGDTRVNGRPPGASTGSTR